MIGRLICLLLLLSSAAMATTHTITSLPYTFDATQMTVGQTDTLVIAGTKLSSATDGITIASTTAEPIYDVVLNLGTDTVIFGTGGGDGNHGVRLTGPNSRRPHNIKVVGGTILHQPNNTTADHNRCIVIGGNDCTFENIKATVRGTNGQVMYGAYIYGIRVIGGEFTSLVTGFDSRCNYDAPVVKFDGLVATPNVSALPGDTLHVSIDGLTITNGPHMGIAIMGRDWSGGDLAFAEIKNCSITTDGRNDTYTSYSGTCYSASNPYGLIFKNIGPGSRMYNNTVTSGNNYAGNRGILIERGRGTAQQPIHIVGNTIDIHEGPNVEYPDGPVHALRIRYGPLHIDVDSNTFIATCDNNPSTTAIGQNINLIRISVDGGGVERANIRVRNNRVEARTLSTSGVEISAVNFDNVQFDSSVFFENNYIASSGKIYEFGGFNGQAPGNWIAGDTVAFLSPQVNAETYHVGYLGLNWDNSGQMARDVVYTAGTSDKDINFSADGTCDITLQRTLRVRVVGNNGLTVSGAQVTVRNGYNQTVVNGVTSNGEYAMPVTYWYESRAGVDSTSFGTFQVKVKKGSDSTMVNHVVDATSSLPIITLQNTAGEGNQVDTIPPAGINDLEANIGNQDGQVILGWTAPGDDGGSGAAAGYTIRYSTSPITTGNWSAASSAPFQGFPQSAGATETMTVSGLVPGEQYFFAVRAYDEEQNVASLSNTPETYSHGIKSPQPTATSPDEDNFRVTVSAATVASYVTVTYQFALDSIVTFPSPRVTTALASGGDPSATFDNLSSGVTYFWRCRAVEAGGSMTSAWSSPVSFDLANGSVNMLTEADMLSPANGGVASGLQPTLEIAEVAGVQFVHFQVENDASFSTPLSSGPITAASGSSTTWQIPYPLTPGQTYYWRASSDNLNWTAAHTFMTPADSATPVSAAEIFAFPNPMNAAEGHSEVTFANLAPESHLTIMSVSGSFVMKDVEVGPGEWVWDGRNENGNTVGSGVYLYYVNAPGRTAKGKIVVIR